jgi:hypothetical protein
VYEFLLMLMSIIVSTSRCSVGLCALNANQ